MASSNDQYQGTDSEKRANVIQEFDPSLLAYHGDRRQGLVPPCEEPGWGFEEPERRDLYRDIYDTKVAKSFLEIDWNKGFTGRGGKP